MSIEIDPSLDPELLIRCEDCPNALVIDRIQAVSISENSIEQKAGGIACELLRTGECIKPEVVSLEGGCGYGAYKKCGNPNVELAVTALAYSPNTI